MPNSDTVRLFIHVAFDSNARSRMAQIKIRTFEQNEVFSEANIHKGPCLPSGNVLGVLAGTATVGIADLEDGADGTAVFPGDSLETYVVFSAVLRMGVSAEAAGCTAHFTRGRTRETSGDLCAMR